MTAKNLVLIFALLSLSACFEIVEESDIREKGEGTLRLTLNMSQSKSQIATFMRMDSIKNYKIPKENQIRLWLDQAQKQMQVQDGIKNIQISSNFTDYIFVATCEFTDAQKLDKAIIATIKYFDKGKNQIPENNFFYKKKTLHRNFDALSQKIIGQQPTTQEALQEAIYTVICRMPDKILSLDNPNFNISKSQKAAMMRISLGEWLRREKSISVAIKHQ